MSTLSVTDADDPRLTPYRAIRERDLVGREGRFIAEGKVVLAAMLGAGRFRLDSLLILEERLAGMADVLGMIDSDLPVYVAPRPVLDAVAGFPMHRGVLGIGVRRPPEPLAPLLAGLAPGAPVIGLVGIANHDNVGAIFRNAAAFGAGAVLLDPTCCDPLYRKAIRVSVGAALRVPFAQAQSANAMIRALDEAGYRIVALSPSGEADIRRMRPAARTALLLGTEGQGLPTAILDTVATVRIAMAPGFDSLNVAAASAVALHALAGLPETMDR